jgi:endoribonuclease Dicer
MDSEYIVMIAEDAYKEYETYKLYKTVEPGLKRRYQSMITEPPSGLTPDDEDGPEDDATENEVYEIASTGARLTSYASIGLLTYLCTLIPTDGYSRLLQPLWKLKNISERHYRCEVTLPPALPLPSDERTYLGPVRRGKKSAKSSAAFLVMQSLLDRGVFDDHILPGALERGDSALDADGNRTVPVSHLTPQIEVDSYDPFGNVHSNHATTLWIHPLYFDGIASTALVTAVEVQSFEATFPLMGRITKRITLGRGVPHASGTDEARQSEVDLLDQYFTKLLATAIAGQKLPPRTAPYVLAPLSPAGDIDWNLIRATLDSPLLNSLSPPPDHLAPGYLVQIINQQGRTFQAVRLREDLNLMSTPEPNSGSKDFASYLDYWSKQGFKLPVDDALIELRWLRKYQPTSTTLSRISNLANHFPSAELQDPVNIVPSSLCRTLRTPFAIFEAFRALPSILRHITDLYRVNLLQNRLQLTSLDQERIVEALTIPSSATQYSFQRLETLGDAVLKVITAVHVFNKFPFRHEGQLDILKTNSVNNNYLLGRAWEAGLQRYLIHEQTIPRWRPASAVTLNDGEWMSEDNQISRKCLPDVVEALLGGKLRNLSRSIV